MANNSSIGCTSIAQQCLLEFGNSSKSLAEKCFTDSRCFFAEEVSNALTGTLIYAAIFLTGITGNLAICIVICFHPIVRATTTSSYLLCLAIADLATLIAGLPLEVYLLWHQYPWVLPNFMCHLKAWVLETTSYVSVLTILAFSVERYVAICHSFSLYRLQFYHKRLLPYLLAAIWVIAFAVATPYGIFHKTYHLVQEWPGNVSSGPIERSKICGFELGKPAVASLYRNLSKTSALFFFILPLAILFFLYIRIALSLRSSHNFLHQQSNRPSASNDFQNTRILFMLLAVVGTFFICYAPFQAQRLLFLYIEDRQLVAQINDHLFLISGTLFYLSSTLNPIMYNVFSTRYRDAFWEVVTCNIPPQNAHGRSLTYLGSSAISISTRHLKIANYCAIDNNSNPGPTERDRLLVVKFKGEACNQRKAKETSL